LADRHRIRRMDLPRALAPSAPIVQGVAMPVARRSAAASFVFAAALLAAAAPAAARVQVPFGSVELGKVATGCLSVCFGTNCSGTGTIDHVKVAQPFHVRGTRVAQYGSGSVCDPDNAVTPANVALPRTIGPNRVLVFDVDLVPTQVGSFERIVEVNETGLFELTANVTALTSCFPSTTAHCLESDRFKVRSHWRSFFGDRGPGTVVPLGLDDSGLFYFFQPDNIEMIAKVLDGCGTNDRFWVFAAATTNVEYTITVTDTETQQVKSYFNPLGNPAPAITDTGAFATCP
jgi:hypothetical protein